MSNIAISKARCLVDSILQMSQRADADDIGSVLSDVAHEMIVDNEAGDPKVASLATAIATLGSIFQD